MIRLVALLAVVCTSLVLGEASTTVTPTPTTTTAHHKPTPSPSPSPTPPTLPANNTYVLMDEAVNRTNNVCLRMLAGVAINFTYVLNDKNKTVNSTVVDFGKATYSEGYCNSSVPEGELKLHYMPEDRNHTYTVAFYFNGDWTKGNQHWSFKNLTLDFTYDNRDFPNYEGPPLPNNSRTMTYTNISLFDETNSFVELTRSYRCNTSQTVGGFEAVTPDNTLNVSLTVIAFHVQAFRFLNATSGEFDNARVCLKDNPNPGNEIVPIAVGAALAVLVIVVLIAYLIGKLRHRKKSSYEPLS